MNFERLIKKSAAQEQTDAREQTSQELRNLLRTKEELRQKQEDLDEAITLARNIKAAQEWRLMVQLRMEYAQHSLKGRINKKSAELTSKQMLKVQQKFDQLLDMSRQPVVPEDFLDEFEQFELFVIELL